jgi:uncharacterized membrane protein YcjF (UPF0283 family)
MKRFQKMAWYETQLAGVVAGGIIGFVASTIREFYNNWQLKKSLKAGLTSEVKVSNISVLLNHQNSCDIHFISQV